MGPTTLTEQDRRLLRRLSTGPQTAGSLAAHAADDPDRLADRLDVLADSGVVRRTDETYELTDSGRRVLAAPGDGSADGWIDVPLAVERELGSQTIDEPCAAAIRAAYGFLQYWGEATASELRDAIFFEQTAGYDDRHQWWAECVEPMFRELPAVRRLDSDLLAARWHSDRPPGVDDAADGRAVFGSTDGQPFGNARRAIEAQVESDDQRVVIREAFAALETRGQATEETLRNVVENIADETSDQRPIPAAFDVLASVPSVQQVDEAGSGGLWRYRHQSR
ncbi:hypothetical protein [Halohasta litorea]|uniref:Uncharacterized protein n=1 Tax=Halohasta litorea TaxID=869891 RepID=A0ABD6D4B9_9EURY|nr:hypothetical protein [Halohasta litorea]